MGQKITKLQPDRRLLRRDGRRHHASSSPPTPGVPVTTTHVITGAIVRRRRGQARLGRPLGVTAQDRLGLDLHHPRRRPDGRARLHDRQSRSTSI
ncbi:MAG: inorganic phosphate transporter [Candidatus Moduliflexus flocculans]|nr:inorganic phosphate transporter [Candidatus Moduliflexus flocculans]